MRPFGACAESAAAAADWLGAMPYPKRSLEWAWKRFLWHQFHDDLTGTSIPAVYRFSWNDELLAQKLFTGVLEDASSAVIRQMDTDVKGAGVPVVVFNRFAIARMAQVDAVIDFGHEPGSWVTAVSLAGQERLATVLQQQGTRAWVRFVADMRPAGIRWWRFAMAGRPKGPRWWNRSRRMR